MELKLGEFIKELRKNNNMTVRDIADQTGISKSYLYNLEKGNQNAPRTDVIIKLAKVFSSNGVSEESIVKSLVSRIEKYSEEEKESILESVKKDPLYNYHFKSIGEFKYIKSDLSKILDTRDVYQELKYTINLNNNKSYTISLGDNIRQHIKSVVDEIVKMHIYNNPEVLKNNKDSNQEIDWNISTNKLKIIEDKEANMNVDNEVYDKK